MSIRIKDFQSLIPRDFGRLFGDDDAVTLALVDEKAIDREKRQLTFVASDDSLDLQGEVVAPGAFHEMRDVYLRNPAILAGHQHKLASGFSPVIGSAIELRTQDNPLIGRMQFGENAVANDHWLAYRDRHQRAFSVGFFVRQTEPRDGHTAIVKALLIEISGVPVGANSNALVLNYIGNRLGALGVGLSGELTLLSELQHARREISEALARLQPASSGRSASADLRAARVALDDALSLEPWQEQEIAECLSAAAGDVDDTSDPDALYDKFLAAERREAEQREALLRELREGLSVAKANHTLASKDGAGVRDQATASLVKTMTEASESLRRLYERP